MSSGSCTAVLDVFRIDGTQVSSADKAHQGSIVNIYNPYRVDYEEFPDPPNNFIEIELTWTAGPSGSVATLEENGPRLGKGTIAIFDDGMLLKPTDHRTIRTIRTIKDRHLSVHRKCKGIYAYPFPILYQHRSPKNNEPVPAPLLNRICGRADRQTDRRAINLSVPRCSTETPSSGDGLRFSETPTPVEKR